MIEGSLPPDYDATESMISWLYSCYQWLYRKWFCTEKKSDFYYVLDYPIATPLYFQGLLGLNMLNSWIYMYTSEFIEII